MQCRLAPSLEGAPLMSSRVSHFVRERSSVLSREGMLRPGLPGRRDRPPAALWRESLAGCRRAHRALWLYRRKNFRKERSRKDTGRQIVMAKQDREARSDAIFYLFRGLYTVCRFSCGLLRRRPHADINRDTAYTISRPAASAPSFPALRPDRGKEWQILAWPRSRPRSGQWPHRSRLYPCSSVRPARPCRRAVDPTPAGPPHSTLLNPYFCFSRRAFSSYRVQERAAPQPAHPLAWRSASWSGRLGLVRASRWERRAPAGSPRSSWQPNSPPFHLSVYGANSSPNLTPLCSAPGADAFRGGRLRHANSLARSLGTGPRYLETDPACVLV